MDNKQKIYKNNSKILIFAKIKFVAKKHIKFITWAEIEEDVRKK